MKWFKHLTASTSNKDIMESEVRFGCSGPYVFWRTLEILAKENAVEEALTINWKVFSMLFPSVSRKKLRTILGYFLEKNRFTFKVDGENISIFCQKLSTISSDYTKKVRSNSEVTPEKFVPEVEVEVEEETTWRTDFEFYCKQLRIARDELLSDSAWVDNQQKDFTGINVERSLNRSLREYWGKEEIWKKMKKKRKSKNVLFKNWLSSNISKNIVYNPRQTNSSGAFEIATQSPYKESTDE